MCNKLVFKLLHSLTDKTVVTFSMFFAREGARAQFLPFDNFLIQNRHKSGGNLFDDIEATLRAPHLSQRTQGVLGHIPFPASPSELANLLGLDFAHFQGISTWSESRAENEWMHKLYKHKFNIYKRQVTWPNKTSSLWTHLSKSVSTTPGANLQMMNAHESMTLHEIFVKMAHVVEDYDYVLFQVQISCLFSTEGEKPIILQIFNLEPFLAWIGYQSNGRL